MKTVPRIIALCLVIYLSTPAQELNFKKISEDNLLSGGSIYCILQDRHGFLWFGTEYGLVRYDGHAIRVFRHDPDQAGSISDNTIWSLVEDRRGFIWIGTAMGGLDRFNPATENFQSWMADTIGSSNHTGLSDNGITALLEDHEGILWIGTYKGGLNRYDPVTGDFRYWRANPGKSGGLQASYITSIYEDISGHLWLGSFNGLISAERNGDSLTFQQFCNEPGNLNSLSHNIIWTLFGSPQDSGKGFWIGTFNGLNYFDFSHNKFIRYLPDPGNPDIFMRSISSILEENRSGRRILWLGSYGGLLRFDPATGIFKRWRHNPDDPTSLSDDRVIDIHLDNSGVLWVATNNGLNFHSRQWENFKIWKEQKPLSGSLISNPLPEITALSRMPDSSLWLGTTRGLYVIRPQEKVAHHDANPLLAGLNIWSLAAGNGKELWIGTYGNGLYRLNTGTGKISHWSESSGGAGPGNNYIKALYRDQQGLLWIGLWGKGLTCFNPETSRWKHYLHKADDPFSLSYDDVWAIYEDHNGLLWIGTRGGGLNLFDRKTKHFYHWLEDPGNPASLSHNSILTISESFPPDSMTGESACILWIGTENGLTRMMYKDRDANNASPPLLNFTSYSENNGLSSPTIRSISKDGMGNVWVGTNLGLEKITGNSFLSGKEQNVKGSLTRQLQINHYSVKDGLPGNDFSNGVVFKAPNGELFWGTSSGLVSFDPSKMQDNHFIPPVVITEIQVLNQPVPVTMISGVVNGNPQTRVLHMNYNQNYISFRFTALDYTSPEECRYSYILEGFDAGWIFSGNRRFVSYTNLNPGKYTFRVRGSNSDGIWNETGTHLILIISRPWWRTGWAYMLYVIFGITTIFLTRKYEMNRIKLRHQLALQKLQTRKFQEMERLKSRFFANLSHEFRTPLMLITGPVEQLRNGLYKENINKAYDLILRNSHKLLNLIEQLLALSQLEAGSLPLRATRENLIPILRGLIYSFESLAEKKGITLTIQTTDDKIEAWIDHDKFDKIISNLLSNAIKFTPEGGAVEMNVSTSLGESFSGKAILISVSDTGIGIPEDRQSRIFDRFYQVDNSTHHSYGGSGIGLALVKELVDLHHWTLSLQSKPGEGSTFTLQIPEGNSHLVESEMISEPPAASAIKPGEESRYPDYTSHDKIRQAPAPSGELSRILIVEDSDDVRFYLADLLGGKFYTEQASTGEEGLKMARSVSPDLIISDVMMAGMNGMEFCRRIKTDWETSHIPVILLTAKAGTESRIEGLETGADDYLTKPFNYRELSVRIKNLLDQRRRLQEKFSREIQVSAAAVTVTSLDQDFLKRAMEIAEKNLDNTDFDSEMFARELFVSRSQLHRKLLAITGKTTGEFLRTLRLKRAAQLLLEKRLSITQIAYEVGFNSPSHFTKAFRQQFNCLPSEFVNKRLS